MSKATVTGARTRERGCSLSEAAEALRHVDPHGRDVWLRMGMALKAEYGDGAFDSWDAWSAEAASYNARDAKAAWKSFKGSGKVTLGTLIHEAKQGGWTPAPEDRSPAERERLEQARAERQRLHQAQAREEAACLTAWQVRIAELAQRCLDEGVLSASGRAPYLGQKKVPAYGLRFVRSGALLIVDERTLSAQIIMGREAVKTWFASGERELAEVSFRYLKAGTVAVPMRNADGMLWGWQFIFAGGAKKFIRHGRKSGCFHLLGTLADGRPLAFAEGYATAASVHQATGWPVAVVFDAGNLPVVAAALRAVHPDTEFIFCADDDHETPGNPGRKAADRAVAESRGVALFPRFEEPIGRSDWNDLHLEQGLGAVRAQLLEAAGTEAGAAQGEAASRKERPRRKERAAGGGGDEPPGDDPGPGAAFDRWADRLVLGRSGQPLATLHNLITILSNREEWAGLFALDAFANQIRLCRKAPYGAQPGAISDVDGSEVAAWFGDPANYGLSVSSKLALEAVEVVAARQRTHPVLSYLDGLRWDGEERLPHLLADFFNAAQDEYTAAVGKNWLMSAVARVREPGCKVDFMVILEGLQGLGKSTAVRLLCGAQWFAEMTESPQNKDFFQVLTGRWIVEIPELQAFSKADRNRIKAAISAQEDTYRPSYGRYARQFPRQNVFVGTTNDDAYLKDETGARRFLPVRCGEVDMRALAAARDQLWAEADARFRRGEPFWEFPEQAKLEQEARYDADAWEDPILKWVEGGGGVDDYPLHYPAIRPDRPVRETTVHDVMLYALKMEIAKHSRPDQMRVAAALKRLGFERGRQKTMPDRRRQHVFTRE